jgi:thiamine transport system substrate-binding protein
MKSPPSLKNPDFCLSFTIVKKSRPNKLEAGDVFSLPLPLFGKIVQVFLQGVRMKRFCFLAVLVAIVAAGCAPKGPVTLNVMTHDSFAASTSVVAAFEKANNVKVVFLKSGDAGAALNKAILTKDAPLADVFYGVDNTFLSRALDSGIYVPYASPVLAQIPAQFKLDTQNRALPVDYSDVCITYDKAYFASHNLPVPVTLEDLAKPEYKNMLVMENPATSSPGLALLMATIQHFGTNGYLDYWKSLRANGVVVVDGWETAYYTNFSGSSGHGPQPLVVSYATDPAAEVVNATTPLTDSPVGSMLGAGTCFRQIEFVGILKGTRQLGLARKFVDFMLGQQFQEDMPLQMYVYPVNPAAKLPDVFAKYNQVPAQPAVLDPALIASSRDRWIQDWTQAVLH